MDKVSTSRHQRYACCACDDDDGDGVSFRRGGVYFRQTSGRRRKRPFHLLHGLLRCDGSGSLDRPVFLCAMTLDCDGGGSCCVSVRPDRVDCPKLGDRICLVQHRQFHQHLPLGWTNQKYPLPGIRWTRRDVCIAYRYECFIDVTKKNQTRNIFPLSIICYQKTGSHKNVLKRYKKEIVSLDSQAAKLFDHESFFFKKRRECKMYRLKPLPKECPVSQSVPLE